MNGVHVPACLSLADHIDAAVRETAGMTMTLDAFVAEIRSDWAIEQQWADADDEGVIRFWQAVEADWLRQMGVSQ